jgi:hypothetical protein
MNQMLRWGRITAALVLTAAMPATRRPSTNSNTTTAATTSVGAIRSTSGCSTRSPSPGAASMAATPATSSRTPRRAGTTWSSGWKCSTCSITSTIRARWARCRRRFPPRPSARKIVCSPDSRIGPRGRYLRPDRRPGHPWQMQFALRFSFQDIRSCERAGGTTGPFPLAGAMAAGLL